MWVPALRGDLVCLLWIWVWIGDLLLLRGRSHYQGLCAITSDPLLSSAHPRPRPLQVALAHCGHKEGWVDQQDNCSARQHKMSPLLCNMMGFKKKKKLLLKVKIFEAISLLFRKCFSWAITTVHVINLGTGLHFVWFIGISHFEQLLALQEPLWVCYYIYPVDCPARWSLSLLYGFLRWSSYFQIQMTGKYCTAKC